MSNQSHLKKLSEGVDAWNSWRARLPHIRPDLSKADLTFREDYSGIDFSEANLKGVNLTGVNLAKAELYDARLEETTLVDVDLSGADIRGADFTAAVIDGTKYDRRMKCLGAKVESCSGNPRFVRHVLETDYIEAFNFDHRFLGALWGVTSLHGRSFGRAGLVAVVLVLFFSLLYWLAPELLVWSNSSAIRGDSNPSWFEPFYYSAGIFTTVGPSTIRPRATWGEVVTTAEVVLGYLWLGYLVSILAQRATARS